MKNTLVLLKFSGTSPAEGKEGYLGTGPVSPRSCSTAHYERKAVARQQIRWLEPAMTFWYHRFGAAKLSTNLGQKLQDIFGISNHPH
jgi:hypothetical protein